MRKTHIAFRSFVAVSMGTYLLFGIPAMGLLVGSGYVSIKLAAFIFLAFGLPGIPATAGFAWLLTRSDRGEIPPVGLVISCALPGALFMFFAGGVIGGNLFGPFGGTVAAIALCLLGTVLGMRLGAIVWSKFLAPA